MPETEPMETMSPGDERDAALSELQDSLDKEVCRWRRQVAAYADTTNGELRLYHKNTALPRLATAEARLHALLDLRAERAALRQQFVEAQDIAREYEIERNEVAALLSAEQAMHIIAETANAKLASQLTEAQADLDWLDTQRTDVTDGGWELLGHAWGVSGQYGTVREAIRAARLASSSEPPTTETPE